MNERILKLASSCFPRDTDGDINATTEMIAEFAELIVRECIDCLKPLSRNHSMVGAAQDTIKEHFGVEE